MRTQQGGFKTAVLSFAELLHVLLPLAFLKRNTCKQRHHCRLAFDRSFATVGKFEMCPDERTKENPPPVFCVLC